MRNRKYPDEVFDFGKPLVHSIDAFETKFVPQVPFKVDEYGEEYNSYYYRSDEFRSEHDGLHVVFSGCSVTFGEALIAEEMWSHKVCEEISKREKLSGYFNLAVPGSSIAFLIIRLFKYIKTFGNPDVIFLNLPPMNRFLSVINGFYNSELIVSTSIPLRNNKPDESSNLLAAAVQFELYSMLEAYCNEAGIKLISFTWNHVVNQRLDPISTAKTLECFDTFHDIHKIYNYENKLRRGISDSVNHNTEEYSEIPFFFARDGIHPGTFDNSFFADSALSIYNNL